jgi:ribonuclease J
MTIRLVPLGGLGEIGMNCLALEAGKPGEGPLVLVDCGVMFPNAVGWSGVDVIHPDFSWLVEQRDRIAALLVTHGHEDHIGGIPYLLRHLPGVPVYGPPYALGLVRERYREHLEADSKLREPELRAMRPRQSFSVGNVEVEPIRVTHSIADALALALHTDDGVVVHTGDFKIDPSPDDGEEFDAERLAELGREGVALLLSDSTNSDAPGVSRAERGVAEALERVVRGARHRVVISLFASNVHRMRAIAGIARRTGRKMALLGRSMHTHVRVASDTGYLAIPPDLFVSFDDAQRVPRHELLVVATGSQAEPRAALARLALDDHPRLRLEPEDTVILSSRAIPGNEIAVMRMVGDLWRRGCIVHLKATDPDIHTSGHAHRDEQRRMIDLVQPAAFVPVHGTRHHLERHAALARDAGVGDVLVIENGEVADADERGVRKVATVKVGKIAVQAGKEIAEAVLRDRALLAEIGVATAAVVVDAHGRPLGEPQVGTKGVLLEEASEEILADARREIEVALATHPWSAERPDPDEVREVARQALRRALGRHTGVKPVAVPLLVRQPR